MSCALLVCGAALAAPAAAHASIVVDDVSVTEGAGGVTAVFTLTRDAGLLAPATSVSFATADATARAPADYVGTTGTRDFPFTLLPATQVQLVAVEVRSDRLDEPNESFRLLVSGPEVADGSGIGTIVDNDAPPAVSVADAAPATEGGTASFAVGLSAPSGRTVTVAYATANGSAVAGQDYTARSGTLTIPAGSTGTTVGVPLLDDGADEPSESFALRLSAPGSASLGDGAGAATILDNDDPPAQAPAAGTSTPAPSAPNVPAPAPASPSSGSATTVRLGLGSPRLRQPNTPLVTVACPQEAGSCTGQVTLFSVPNKRSKIGALRKERRLGREPFALTAGRTQTLTFTLARHDRGLLERAGRINVRAYAVTKDGAGRSGVRTANGTLLRRTAHSSAGAAASPARGQGLDEIGGALGAEAGRRPRL